MAEVPEAEIEAVEGDEGILSVGSFLPFFWDDDGILLVNVFTTFVG